MGRRLTPLARGLVIITTGCLILAAGVVVGASVRHRALAIPRHGSYWQQAAPYNSAYDNPAVIASLSSSKAVAIIVPHHLMVSNYTASVFKSLESQQYKTVVLIGPNHYSLGQDTIITSRADWDTPYGVLAADRWLVANLARQGGTVVDEVPFVVEHSISGLVPFIKRSFPQAKIVPIILQPTATVADGVALGQTIDMLTDSGTTLVIGSVDFSHEWPTATADAHDVVTAELIRAFDIKHLDEVDADSPAAIAAVLTYAQNNQVTTAQEVFHTNSGRLIGREAEATTSHFGWEFSRD